MEIAWIERSPALTWHIALGAVVEELGRQSGTSVRRAVGVVDAPDADAYIAVAATKDLLVQEVADVAARVPSRLRRLIVVGAPLDFAPSYPVPAPGTIAALLERHRLGGAVAPAAFLDWREAPSQFAGPKVLMTRLQSNALKASQSDHYAVWFSTRGSSLADFLGRYLPVLDEHVRTEPEALGP
jgi:hypothetical protein